MSHIIVDTNGKVIFRFGLAHFVEDALDHCRGEFL